jgi:membrane associated rhomboid family serine protease
MIQNSSLQPTRFVKFIVIVNVFFFTAKLLFGFLGAIDLNEYLAIHYWNGPLFQPYQLITHLFMHGASILDSTGAVSQMDIQDTVKHLGANMLSFFLFGSILESQIGWRKTFIIYFASGLGAILIHFGYMQYQESIYWNAIKLFEANPTWREYNYLLTRNISENELTKPLYEILKDWENQPSNSSFIVEVKMALQQYGQQYKNASCLGASGAVMGILVATIMRDPNAKYQFMLPVPIWIIGIIYFTFEIKLGFYKEQGDNTAHFAHVGGMIVGLILSGIFQLINKNKRN